MLATANGMIAGSVSGGCVETATALEIEAAIESGTPKLVTFGVTNERAWEVGLACGGTIKVFVEPTVRPEVLQAARGSGSERLLESGLSDAQVARLHGPIGLDLGGRQPAEIALAILAQMTAVRYGGRVERKEQR